MATATDVSPITEKQLRARTLTKLKGKYSKIVINIQRIIDEKKLTSSNSF